jgi:hypothetical protein
VKNRVRAAAEERLRRVGQELVSQMKIDVGGPSPSPPGGPPGRLTGTLWRSIRGRITKPTKDRTRLTILGAVYAIPLEYAKTAKRRRPFLGGALEYAKDALRRWFPR